MTLLVALACVALTYGPLFILGRTTRIGSPAHLPVAVGAAMYHILAQLAKLSLVATLAPEDHPVATLVLQMAVQVIDVAALAMVLSSALPLKRTPALGHVDASAAALGWVAADSVPRVLAFWGTGRGFAFDWMHVWSAVEANLELLYVAALALGLVRLRRTLKSKKNLRPALMGLDGVVALLTTPGALAFVVVHALGPCMPWWGSGVRAAAVALWVFVLSSSGARSHP
jgi:hypothetical protein